MNVGAPSLLGCLPASAHRRKPDTGALWRRFTRRSIAFHYIEQE